MRVISKKNRIVALFGGSFNPPHRGHIAVVRNLLRRRSIQQVWIVPVYQHPFAKGLLPYTKRWQMCRLAFSPLSSRIKISRVEALLGGKSYTVKTLRYLTRRYPKTHFVWVMGEDAYRARSKWKDFNIIAAMTEIYVVPLYRVAGRQKISSAATRASIAKQQSIAKLVSPGVAHYIKKNGLYVRQ